MKPSRLPSNRQRKHSGQNTLTISVDMTSVNRLVQMLKEDMEDAVRPAAQAAAQVLYDEVKKNVAAIGKKTGRLSESIYQAYSLPNSGKGRAVYHVSWNSNVAPHAINVEYGHIQRYQVIVTSTGRFVTLKNSPLSQPRQVAARPFIRPAVAKFDEAAKAAEAEILRRFLEKFK